MMYFRCTVRTRVCVFRSERVNFYKMFTEILLAILPFRYNLLVFLSPAVLCACTELRIFYSVVTTLILTWKLRVIPLENHTFLFHFCVKIVPILFIKFSNSVVYFDFISVCTDHYQDCSPPLCRCLHQDRSIRCVGWMTVRLSTVP